MFLLPLIPSILQSLYFTFVMTRLDVGLAKPKKVVWLAWDKNADQEKVRGVMILRRGSRLTSRWFPSD